MLSVKQVKSHQVKLGNVVGGRGVGTGKIRAGGGREAGGYRAGYRSRVRTGGWRRIKDIKFFNYFLVSFQAIYQKSEPKTIDFPHLLF